MWFLIDNPGVLLLVLFLIGLLIYAVVLLKKENSLNTLLQNKQYSMRLEITKKVPFTKRMKLIMVSTVTPVIVIALVLSVGLGMSKMESDMVESQANLNNVEQIYSDFSSRMDAYSNSDFRQYFGAEDEILDSGLDFVSAPESSPDVTTDSGLNNLTVKSASHTYGSDTFDTTTTDEQYIYSVDGSDVVITLAYTSSLKADALEEYKELPQGDFVINGLYVDEDKLIVIKSECSSIVADTVCESVTVLVYSKANEFELIDTYTLSGNLIATKKIENNLFVITNEMIPFESSDFYLDDYLPVYNNGNTVTASYDDIVYSEGTYPNSFTTVYGIQLDSNDVDMEVMLADYRYKFYLSEKSIYLLGNAYIFDSTGTNDLEVKTGIIEIGMNGNNVEYVATGYVEGYTLNDMAIQEYNNQLRIITTTVESLYQTSSNIASWNQEIVNRLWFLDDDLNTINVQGNTLSLITSGETVKSATFIEDYVYIQTFENTESLYVVDLSDEEKSVNVELMELIGNNHLLLPVTNELVVGIHLYEEEDNTKAISISTYEISDKVNPVYKDQYVLIDGTFGYDWSSATYDLNGVEVNIDEGLILIPYTLVRLEGSENITYTGILVFSLDTSFNLVNSYNVSHETNLGESVEIQKYLFIDEYMYTVSDSYIKVSLIENPDVFLHSVSYDNE